MPTAKKKATSWSSVFDMPLDELQSRVAKARDLMQQAVDLFPGLLVLTEEQRLHTNGRIRKGEGAMFLRIIDVMEAFPQFFEGLADLDEGVDPTKVETGLIRDRIQRAEALAPLLGLADTLNGLSDTVLNLRGLVRDPMKEAYGLAKGLARTNPKLSSMLAPVIDFYAAMAKAAAAARKANAAKSPKG